MKPGLWAAQILAGQPRQPDGFSCGAATLVMARAVADEAYAELLVSGVHPRTGWRLPGTLEERFHAETLGMHRRITSAADVAGRLQPPWPRLFGTPPWAVARQLAAVGTPYVIGQALIARPRVFAEVLTQVRSGKPVALYVGDLWASRHVVLAFDATDVGLIAFDPASGRSEEVRPEQFIERRLPFGRWRRPWFVVRPAG